MSPRSWKILSAVKETAWRLFEILFWAAIVCTAASNFYLWVIGQGTRSPEGERCGPHHHWGYVRMGEDLELTCESD